MLIDTIRKLDRKSINKFLGDNPFTVTFLTKDKELRVITGRVNVTWKVNGRGKETPDNATYFKVFDMEQKDWRTIHIDNIIDITFPPTRFQKTIAFITFLIKNYNHNPFNNIFTYVSIMLIIAAAIAGNKDALFISTGILVASPILSFASKVARYTKLHLTH